MIAPTQNFVQAGQWQANFPQPTVEGAGQGPRKAFPITFLAMPPCYQQRSQRFDPLPDYNGQWWQGQSARRAPAVLVVQAAITLPATANRRWKLFGLNFGFNGTPTNGKLIISWGDGGQVYQEVYYITTGVLQTLTFSPPKVYAIDGDVELSLTCDNAVGGYLYPQYELRISG